MKPDLLNDTEYLRKQNAYMSEFLSHSFLCASEIGILVARVGIDSFFLLLSQGPTTLTLSLSVLFTVLTHRVSG